MLPSQRRLRCEGCVPPFWLHANDGSLGYRFPSSPKVWSWPANEVAEIAARWRSGRSRPLPKGVTRIVEAHTAFVRLVAEGELARPDVIVHDLEGAEIRAFWQEARLQVVVDIDAPERTIGSLADQDAA